MLEKYNDNITATVFGIYLLGIVVYVVQLIFMTEVWLKGEEIDLSAVIVARVMGATWLGFGVGLLLTYFRGPDGQRSFFIGLIVAQIGTLLCLLNAYMQGVSKAGDDVIIVTVLLVLVLTGCYRIKSRL
jgi:hypothetical protein